MSKNWENLFVRPVAPVSLRSGSFRTGHWYASAGVDPEHRSDGKLDAVRLRIPASSSSFQIFDKQDLVELRDFLDAVIDVFDKESQS